MKSPPTSTPTYSPLARIARACLAIALAVIVASGCARDGRFELLSIDPLETTRLDAGRSFLLTGSGFPVGREVEIALHGMSHAPLGVRRRVSHALRGRTTSPERIELVATDADIAALGGRATFEGSLEVVVHGASLDGLAARVVGVLDDVVLDIVPSERRSTSRREASAGLDLARVLGLELASDARLDEGGGEEGDGEDDLDEELEPAAREMSAVEGEEPGILIAAIDPAGAAAQLGLVSVGLEPDARILSLDDMNVLDPDELRVDPRASRVAVTLTNAAGRTRSIAVDLDAAQGRRPDRTTRYDQLAIIVVVGALLFGVWPWSRARRRGAPVAGTASRDDRPVAAVLTAALALLAVLALSTLTPDAWLHGSIALWLAAALFLRASAALATSAPPREASPRTRSKLGELGARAARLVRPESARALASAIAATVAVGVFLTARGTIESASLPLLGGPLASAPWMPMSWSLVRAPFGPFALAALLAAASSTSRGIEAPRTRTERVLRGVDELGLAALASVFVRITIADASSTDLASRATALVATVVLYAAMLRARSVARGAASIAWRGPLLACAVAASATIAVAIAWLSLETGGPTLAGTFAGEQAVAEVVLVCVGLLVVRVATLHVETEHASATAS